MASLIPDQPELLALASLAAVPASKMAAAFNDPVRFFEHLDLEALLRIQNACERLGEMQTAMLEALSIFTEAARLALAEAQGAEDAD